MVTLESLLLRTHSPKGFRYAFRFQAKPFSRNGHSHDS